MSKPNYSPKFRGWPIIIIFLTGCVIYSTQATVPTEIQTQPFMITTLIKSITPTNIIEKTSTKTPTVTPSPSSKPPVLTSTLQPTLSAEESKSLLLNLLVSNGDCLLPCIWGQIPGETDLKSIDNFVSRFGKATRENEFFVDHSESSNGKYSGLSIVYWKGNSENLSRVSIILDYPRIYEKVRILSFYSEVALQSGEGPNQKSIVTYSNPFFYQFLQLYMLPKILTDYGPPSKALVLPYYDNPFNPAGFVVPFSLILYYKERGIYVEYLFPREISGVFYKGCPFKTGTIILRTWDPAGDVTLEEIVNDKSVGINGLKFTKSMDDASSLTVDQFYQIFKDINNRTCIETPIELWDMKKAPISTP